MANGRFVQEYQKNAVNGSSPLQLVVMMYDGALRFMEAGKHGLETGDREKQNYSVQKAQKIVMELMSCLDMQQGGEVAKNLLAIYSYVLNELVMANVSDSPDQITRCISIFRDLRESWAEIERSKRNAVVEGDQIAA